MQAQTNSITLHSVAYTRTLGNFDLSIGKVRGFVLGDSMVFVLNSENAILEAQGDDFLFYRVLCDSTISTEISYVFDDKGLLVSIGIEFFESCKHTLFGYVADEFMINFNSFYKNNLLNETGFLKWKSGTGVNIEFQKQQIEKCLIHTQIEFY